MKKKLIGLVLASSLALLGAIPVAASGPPGAASASTSHGSQARATCYRASCNGKDPIATNCSATTSTAAYRSVLWDSYSKTYLQVWNRWSSLCQINWPRVAFSGDTSSGVDAFAQYGHGPVNPNAPEFDFTFYSARASLVWGNMVDGGSGTPCVTAWGTIGGVLGEAIPTACV